MIEADVHLDANNTATLEASYGLLHFNSNLLTDTQQLSVVGGYDRKMSARDSIGLDGAFTRFGFTGTGATVSVESVSALYARRISGRSSLELGAGPQIAQSSLSGLNQQYLGWQARGTVNYRMRRLNLSAQGMRTVTGGAGVLNGALTTTGQGTANFILSRNWSTSLNSGISRNQQLSSAESFDTQFAGVVLNRKCGRYTNAVPEL